MRLWPFIKKRTVEDPGQPINIGEVWDRQSTVVSAMSISAVIACVRVLSESVGSLAWMVYQRNGAARDRANDHEAYTLLHYRPNPLMSSISFRERIMQDILLHGNSYCLIDRDRTSSKPTAIWPIAPSAVTPLLSMDRRDMTYQVSAKGFESIYRAEDILHVPCLGNGIIGKSVVAYNAGAFALAADQDDYARTFFANGAYAGGVLEADKVISREAKERLRDGWQRAYGKNGSGAAGWHKVAILEEGMKWKAMTVNPRDAMALESRQFQVADIARMFRVPPHLVGDLTRSTFSNIEHQSLEFVMHSLRPWLVRIEQEYNWKLFPKDDRKVYFSEFLIDSMLRGDIKSRNEAYAVMRQNGVLSANEWRSRENLNPLPGDQGDKYIVQLNMQELSQVGAPVTPPAPSPEPPDPPADTQEDQDEES